MIESIKLRSPCARNAFVTVFAFFCAAALPPILMTAYGVINSGWPHDDDLVMAGVTTLFYFYFSCTITFGIGLPAYLVAVHFKKVNIWSGLLAGLLTGFGAALVLPNENYFWLLYLLSGAGAGILFVGVLRWGKVVTGTSSDNITNP